MAVQVRLTSIRFDQEIHLNSNQGRSRLIALTVGCALAVPLLTLPASGAVSDGKFKVHAWNLDTPKIEAYAGNSGTGSDAGGNPGGGTTDPDPGEALASFRSGPLSITVTDDMLAFSEANRKAQEEGRTEDIRTHSDGWQTIWSYDATSGSIVPGLPDKNTILVVLAKNSLQPSPGDAVNGTGGQITAVYLKNADDWYSISDYRKTPSPGVSYYYAVSGNYYGESRYFSEDGTLVGVNVAHQNDGSMTVNRQDDPTKFTSYPKSNSKPYSIRFEDGQPTDMNILLKDSSKGYNQIQVQKTDSSMFNIYYRNYKGQTPDGQNDMDYGTRTDGPVSLIIDGSTGKIANSGYRDKNGNMQSTGALSGVAEYNQVTGQSWDGKYPKYSDFDISIPFEPTKP